MSDEKSDEKADVRAVFEEFFAEIVLTRKETQLLRQEVQNLTADLSLTTENMKGWINHLEEVFSKGAVVAIMVKELNKLTAISTKLEEVSGNLKHDFELIQKPKKRRFFGF